MCSTLLWSLVERSESFSMCFLSASGFVRFTFFFWPSFFLINNDGFLYIYYIFCLAHLFVYDIDFMNFV